MTGVPGALRPPAFLEPGIGIDRWIAAAAARRDGCVSGDAAPVVDRRRRPDRVGRSVARSDQQRTRSLGDLPLFVLSVTEQDKYADVLTALQAELPKLSSNSMHLTVQGATHDGLVCQREHALVVADAIRQVVEAAHTGQPLAQK